MAASGHREKKADTTYILDTEMNRVRMDVGGEGVKMLKIFMGWA